MKNNISANGFQQIRVYLTPENVAYLSSKDKSISKLIDKLITMDKSKYEKD